VINLGWCDAASRRGIGMHIGLNPEAASEDEDDADEGASQKTKLRPGLL
jgi:hypothetical protein